MRFTSQKSKEKLLVKRKNLEISLSLWRVFLQCVAWWFPKKSTRNLVVKLYDAIWVFPKIGGKTLKMDGLKWFQTILKFHGFGGKNPLFLGSTPIYGSWMLTAKIETIEEDIRTQGLNAWKAWKTELCGCGFLLDMLWLVSYELDPRRMCL